jgi:L-lactate utilization protein LutC
MSSYATSFSLPRLDAASSSNTKAGAKKGAEALVKKALKKAAAQKEALLLDQEMEQLAATSLDDLDYEIDENDLEDIEDDDADYATPKAAAAERKAVKLSSILPKPSPKGTPKAAAPKATPTPTTTGKRGR